MKIEEDYNVISHYPEQGPTIQKVIISYFDYYLKEHLMNLKEEYE